MHLSNRPDDFPTDKKKVNFALSFLTSVAKDFFSPDIFMALQDPFTRALPWRNDFHEFIRVLSEKFGPFDSIGTAENTLNNLVMDASKPIANYITHFNAAATLVGWDDNSLRFQFWRGLPARLRTKLTERPGGKPKTLVELQYAAQEIDGQYWQNKEEQDRDRQRSAKSQPLSSSHPAGSSSSSNSRHLAANPSTSTPPAANPPKPSNSASSAPRTRPSCLSQLKIKFALWKGGMICLLLPSMSLYPLSFLSILISSRYHLSQVFHKGVSAMQ